MLCTASVIACQLFPDSCSYTALDAAKYIHQCCTVRRFFDEGIGFRGMRKLDRRRRANFEFVREGQFQKEAEVARIRVSTVTANLCRWLECCCYWNKQQARPNDCLLLAARVWR